MSSKQYGGFEDCHWIVRSVSCLGSIDRTICSVSSKPRLQREAMVALTPNSLSCSQYSYPALSGGRWGRGAWRGFTPAPSRATPLAPIALGHQDARWIVAFPADHQLPDDAGILVGQGDGRQLGRLASEELDQPGRGLPFSVLYLLDHGGGADHQHAAQSLVAGAGDHAKPRLAGRRVILRGGSEPGRKVAAAAERMRIGDLHDRQRSADRANTWNLLQPLAQFVVLVPSHQPGFDFCNLDLQPGIFPGVGGKQLHCQLGKCRLRDAAQQRLNLVEPLGGGQPKLGGITADRVGKLRAAADQPVTRACQHQCSLLLGGLYRHESHRRPAHGFADRLRISGVILVPLDVWLDVLRRHQNDLVPQRSQLARPIMRRPTGLQPHLDRLQLRKELKHLLAPQLPAQNRLLRRINSVQNENTLGRVHTNADNLRHGRLPGLRSPTTSFWHSDAVGGRPPQQYPWSVVTGSPGQAG